MTQSWTRGSLLLTRLYNLLQGFHILRVALSTFVLPKHSIKFKVTDKSLADYKTRLHTKTMIHVFVLLGLTLAAILYGIQRGMALEHGTGFLYSGDLTPDEIAPVDYPVGKPKHGALTPGDTIEIHYVHSTAPVEPGPTLGACLSDVVLNPQLRVEAQVFVLVNDDNAANFVLMNLIGKKDGFHQAINLPNDSGTPIVYAGSTTGPSFNQAGSPLEVTWSVRPEVIKVNIASVAAWLNGNPFDEDHAHGVRNLVTNPDLLSNIGG